jgi:hypothetical protein
MSEIAYLLRLLAQGDKEGKITVQPVCGAAAAFTSQLTSGQTRKGFSAYNSSSVTASGELYYGYSESLSPSGESKPIPQGAVVDIPVSADIPVYFIAETNESGELRVEEIA